MIDTNDPRPTVAVLTTVYFEGSHADVIIPRLVEGYEYRSQSTPPRLRVASVYLEQTPDGSDAHPTRDVGAAFVEEHGIMRADTVGEALGAGSTGVNVDGVVIIGEHGEYESNEFGQTLYPRRRLFDAAVSAMVTAGRFVPIFNDKGLSYSAVDAVAMLDTSRRLGIPLAAGSTIPISWRIPAGAEAPLGAPVSDAVLVGWGPLERYGFHSLEGLQAHLERRRGFETGIASVVALEAVQARAAIADGRIDPTLLRSAIGTLELDRSEREAALAAIGGTMMLEYRDGTKAAVVNCNVDGSGVVKQFGYASRGDAGPFSCMMWLQGAPEHGHFTFLTRQIEDLILRGRARIPVERTVLTTGALDAAMRSWAVGGARVETPELAIAYAPPSDSDGSGISLLRPDGHTREG